ncbi:LacI family transcriptional regulator [Novosphingobium pentaromativorans US6-1]|uniref:LacI family transcriptional regulator n=1 Tax=Novosphingobium pentaromativorans US6-1 TaxID=1088721 RepID=G6EFV2_9SPHN|nr:LacI family transcriptional regulator [Novosphingobium pentaromativorans US6-1]
MGRTRKRATKGATMAAVARRAGVSAMTVSNVINNKVSVQPGTREAVLKAIAELDYRPNAAARALASASTLRIGLLHRDQDSALLSAMLVGSLKAASRIGVQLIIQPYNPDTALEDILEFAESGLDGLLLPPPLCEQFSDSGLSARINIPVVAMAPGTSLPDIACVRIDDEAAAFALTSSLIVHGHRRIAFVLLPGTHVGKARLEGYRRALREAGIPEDPDLIWQARPTFSEGLVLAERKLGTAEKPVAQGPFTAIMAGNDDMAAAFVNVALRLGKRIPEDLSITGFDDTPIAIKIWPTLTTVRQPLAEIAEQATELLIAMLRNPSAQGPSAQGAVPRFVDYKLVERASVADVAPE